MDLKGTGQRPHVRPHLRIRHCCSEARSCSEAILCSGHGCRQSLLLPHEVSSLCMLLLWGFDHCVRRVVVQGRLNPTCMSRRVRSLALVIAVALAVGAGPSF